MPYSFLDLDNTLYKGRFRHVIFDFPVYLNSKGLFNADSIDEFSDLRKKYDDGEIDRDFFTIEAIKSYYRGLEGVQVDTFNIEVTNFWRDFNSIAWFSYTFALIELLNKYTETILISGSPIEVIRGISNKIGINQLYATSGEIKNNRYTGNYDPLNEMATGKAKERLIKQIKKDVGYDATLSFAFGDSESDFPLFLSVDSKNAYLISESKKLRNYGVQMGWNVLFHNENIVQAVSKRISEIIPNRK